MKLEPILDAHAAPVPPALSSDRMGELFIQAGKLTRAQVEQIIQLQETSQLRFGEAARQLNLLSERDIQAVLAHQFNYVTATNLRVGLDAACPLPIANSPYSPEAEAIRRIRSELLLEARGLTPMQLAVVSPSGGEGRTYMAANLAFSFAQVGKRTLLIDADFRSPKIHAYFSMNNKKGLSGVLSGRSDVTLDVMTMVLPNLYVLPAGPLPPNPLEILQDPNLSALIDKLARDLDVIVVDTPAAMASSDSKVIARQVGAALVVGREHRTRIADLRVTVQAMQDVGVRVFGTVYNRYDGRSGAASSVAVSPPPPLVVRALAPAPLRAHALTGGPVAVGKPFWTHSLLSVVDQVLLSGLNFAVGMCLIRFGSKSDYGLYSQLFAASLFAVGLLEALIGSPLTTLAPHMPAPQQALAIRRLQRWQCMAGAVLGLLFGLIAAWVVWDGVPEVAPGPVGLGFAVFVGMTTAREYRRTVWFIQTDLRSLLLSDGLYVLLALLGGAALALSKQVGAASILGVLSVAQGLALVVGQGPALAPTDTPSPLWSETLAAVWDKGRWAMPGMVVGWLGNYSFLYLASAMSGVEAAAEVSASRLLLVPVGLMVVAWSRVARPLAGRLIHARDWRSLNRLSLASLGGIEALSLVYMLMLVLALPWLQAHVLGAKYQGINTLVMAWGAYFLVSVARTIATTWLVSIGAFRQLFVEGSVVVLFMLVVASVTIPQWGALGAVLALIAMESFDFLLLLGLIAYQRRRLSRELPHA